MLCVPLGVIVLDSLSTTSLVGLVVPDAFYYMLKEAITRSFM